MPIDPSKLLNFGREGSLAPALMGLGQAFQQGQRFRQQQEQAKLQMAATQRDEQAKTLALKAQEILPLLDSGNIDQAAAAIEASRDQLKQLGATDQRVDALIGQIRTNPDQAKAFAENLIGQARSIGVIGGTQSSVPAAVQEFDKLTQIANDPNQPENVRRAAQIRLGLEKRAGTTSASQVVDIGGVPFTFDPNTNTFSGATVDGKEITASSIAEAREKIKGAETFAGEQAKQRSSDLAAAAKEITTIKKGIGNADRVLDLLNKGANVGRVSNLLPSINNATLEMQQILGEEVLNQLSNVTLGAISESELSLLKEVALPTNLDEKGLRDYMRRKKQALEKAQDVALDLVKYLRENPGKTKADFILDRSGKAQQPQQQQNVIDWNEL